jgi:DNA-binding transcriptional ArsR family regulator
VNEPIRSLAELDRLVHEPGRLAITSLLSAAEEADFLYLLNETGLTKGNLSSHLSKLEAAGYVSIEKAYRGKIPLTICRPTPADRTAFKQYRSALKASL